MNIVKDNIKWASNLTFILLGLFFLDFLFEHIFITKRFSVNAITDFLPLVLMLSALAVVIREGYTIVKYIFLFIFCSSIYWDYIDTTSIVKTQGYEAIGVELYRSTLSVISNLLLLAIIVLLFLGKRN